MRRILSGGRLPRGEVSFYGDGNKNNCKYIFHSIFEMLKKLFLSGPTARESALSFECSVRNHIPRFHQCNANWLSFNQSSFEGFVRKTWKIKFLVFLLSFELWAVLPILFIFLPCTFVVCTFVHCIFELYFFAVGNDLFWSKMDWTVKKEKSF